MAYRPAGPAIAVSLDENDQESGSCEPGYLNWSSVYHGNLEYILKSIKKCLKSQTDKLASENEDSVLLCEFPPEGVAQIWGGCSHFK